MNDNEKLIEEARILSDREWQAHWPGRAQRALRSLADALEATEKAHTPTDDEREALAYLITAHRFRERGLTGAIGEPEIAISRPLAEFLQREGFRRTEVPEPSSAVSPPCACSCHTMLGVEHVVPCCYPAPQGEPSDAQEAVARLERCLANREAGVGAWSMVRPADVRTVLAALRAAGGVR